MGFSGTSRLFCLFALVSSLGFPLHAFSSDTPQVTISVDSFEWDGKPIREAYADALRAAQKDCSNSRQWYDRIQVYARFAREQYQAALPKVPLAYRKQIEANCEAEKKTSLEAFEVCYAIELGHQAQRAARGNSADRELAPSLRSAAHQLNRAIGAWTIAGNLRVTCDEQYGTAQKSEPCTSRHSPKEWHDQFRPTQDPTPLASAQGLQLPPKTECTPRSDKLEDTIDACLNDGCAQEKTWNNERSCRILAETGLTSMASGTLMRSMSYLDADSIVFLTRSKLAMQLLEGHAQATGRKLTDLPSECRESPQLAEGLTQWASSSPPSVAPAAALNQNLNALIEASSKIQKLHNQTQELIKKSGEKCSPNGGVMECVTEIPREAEILDELATQALLDQPALMPPQYPDAAFEVAQRIAQSPARAKDILLENADKKAQNGLKKICAADWIELMNLPMAQPIARELGAHLSRVGGQDQEPWVLRCIHSRPTAHDKRQTIMWGCMSVSLGVALMTPPAGAALGYSCGAISAGGHGVAIAEKASELRLTVACAGLQSKACPPESLAKVESELNHEISAMALDLALQGASPIIIRQTLRGLIKGGTFTFSKARDLLNQLRSLRQQKPGEKELLESLQALTQSGAARVTPPTPPQAPAANLANPVSDEAEYALQNYRIRTLAPRTTPLKRAEVIPPKLLENIKKWTSSTREMGRIQKISRVKSTTITAIREDIVKQAVKAGLSASDPQVQLALKAFDALHNNRLIYKQVREWLTDAAKLQLASSSASQVEQAVAGNLSRRYLLLSLLEKARGLGFTKTAQITENCCSANEFYEILHSGALFVDRASHRGRHGQDAHLLQIMLIAPELEKVRRGATLELRQFLGSPKGQALWRDIFDSSEDAWTTPESITALLKELPGYR